MYNLCQYNEARALAPLDDPLLSDFVNAQDALYNASDVSQGFVWRLADETGRTGSFRPFEDKQILVGLSVWRDVPSLKEFVYGKEHASLIRRRRTWFEAHNSANYVLWCKRASELPTVAEGQERLAQLRLNGPILHAFDFKTHFAPPAILVGSLGPKGTNSEKATKEYMNRECDGGELLLFDTFEEVAKALLEGGLDRAMVCTAYLKFSALYFEHVPRLRMIEPFVADLHPMVMTFGVVALIFNLVQLYRGAGYLRLMRTSAKEVLWLNLLSAANLVSYYWAIRTVPVSSHASIALGVGPLVVLLLGCGANGRNDRGEVISAVGLALSLLLIAGVRMGRAGLFDLAVSFVCGVSLVLSLFSQRRLKALGGNDVLGKPKHEQKKSSEQQVTAESRRRYFVTLLFAFIFITSITTLFINYKNRLTGDGNRAHLSSDVIIWITVFTAIVSAIGTFSTIILAWRSDKRDAREKELKIAQLERELAASSERRTLPASEENRQ